jgi:hypothetical protein
MSKSAMLLATSLAATLGCVGGGQSCPDLAHIVAGGFERTTDTLSWTLEVADLPDEITFNQTAVPPSFLEYRWAVDIDSDRNRQPDLSVAISHFVLSGTMPVTTANILSVAAADLQEVEHLPDGTIVSSTIGDIAATITGNTFRFEVAATEAPGLAVVSDASQSTWTTYYRWGAEDGDQCEETLR